MERCSGGSQGWDSAPCQQAHPESRVLGIHLCRKEREPLTFSLLSTTPLTAALWPYHTSRETSRCHGTALGFLTPNVLLCAFEFHSWPG